MRRQYIILLLLLIISLFGSSQITAQTERIINYQSNIIIHGDASMTVTETIRVMAAGNKIKRGIYREFPTTYKDRFGKRIKVGFKIIEVLRDGQPESFHTEHMPNGLKIYFGQKDLFLPSGEYTYTFTYQTTRQIGYFPEFDELYWNVTGNAWDFVIENASAILTLPPGATALDAVAYTGYQGENKSNYRMTKQSASQVLFETTAPLQPQQGLTIAVSWPKGILPQPTLQDHFNYFMHDNPAATSGFLGLAILLAYYFFAWVRVGKDPEKGTIIPLFSPPKGISPAAARYIMKMGYSDRVFASAIVNMAVKGYLKIEDDDGEFSIVRDDADKSVLTRGEAKIAHKLLGGSQRITLKQSNHTRIKRSIDALKSYLKLEFEKVYFFKNSKVIIPGIIITILAFAGMIISAPQLMGAAFISIWLSIWSIGVFALVTTAVKSWRGAMSQRGIKGVGQKAGAFGMTLFALPFVGGELIGLWFFSQLMSYAGTLVFLCLIAINLIFYHLMKAPTLHGRRIMDKLEGFKMYMEFAEEQRLNFLHPPDRTPELFEKYLPYALALGVENAWSEKFSDVLAKAAEDRSYSPRWYSGTHWHTSGFSGLASNLGSSFSSAISSSSTAPGSSSGSGGGGFSGGGGGGGGGGGW